MQLQQRRVGLLVRGSTGKFDGPRARFFVPDDRVENLNDKRPDSQSSD